MKRDKIAFIVEGTKTEPELISKSLNNVYFAKIKLISLFYPPE